METVKFIHRVSKGSRFNQIYIPQEFRGDFSAGNLVEVRLLERKELHYSKGLKLNEFKEGLAGNIFSFLSEFKGIEQAFIVGSFLKRNDYNDIDIVLVAESELGIEEELAEKFGMKFHVISISKERFFRLLRICPLTRSTLYNYTSNKETSLLKNREIDLNHLKFLLMMPEDLLEIKASGRAYYDSIRRLIAIERFLKNKEENPEKINLESEELLGKSLFTKLRDNEYIEGAGLERVRGIIKSKLNKIKGEIGNGQK